MDNDSLEARLKTMEDRLLRLEGLLPAKSGPAAGVPLRAVPSLAPVRPKSPPPAPVDWEALAGVWFNRVGIAALVLGISFFLKYAFDHRWIGELGRVTMGVLSGIGMIYGGDCFQRRGMRRYGQMLMGGGIVVLYLSIYAAFSFYHLMGQAPAFAFMCLVTAGACALAVRQDAWPVAAVGLLGGFLTPRLMSTGLVQEYVLFTYLAVLNGGLMAVSFFKDWRAMGLAALALTQIYVQAYIGMDFKAEFLFPLVSYLAVYWVVFIASSTGHFLKDGRPSGSEDLGLALLNAATFFGTVYGRLNGGYHACMGALAVAVAGAYWALASLLKRREPGDRNLVLAHLGLAIVFLTLAVPIQLELKWITIGWAAEAAALFLAGAKLEHREMRFMAAGVMIVAVLRAVFMDSWLKLPHAFLLNERGLAYVFVLGAIALVVDGYRRLGRPAEGEADLRSLFGVTGVLLGLWLLSIEGYEYWESLPIDARQALFGAGFDARRNMEIAQNFSISAVWVLYGFAWFLYGIWQDRRPIRLLALVILSAAVGKVFLHDLSFLRTIWRIVIFLGLGLVTMAVSYYYERIKPRMAP